MTQTQFVDALKLFLDTAEPGELESLAVRLEPYRITSLQVQKPDGAPTAKSIPVIVLDDGSKAPEQIPFSFEQQLNSLTAGSHSGTMTPQYPQPGMGMPTTLTPPMDTFCDFNSLPWATDPSFLTAPGNLDLSMEDMMIDDSQFGDLPAEYSMPSTPRFYTTMPDSNGLPISPPYSELFDCSAAPSTYSSYPCSPSTAFFETPVHSPPQCSDLDNNLAPPSNPSPASTIHVVAQRSPRSRGTSPNPRSCSTQNNKISRRSNNSRNPSRSRSRTSTTARTTTKAPTAASITQAILSSSTGADPKSIAQTSPAAAALVFSSCIRKDYLDFLKTNLPEWVREGLWRSSSPNSYSNTNNNNNNNNSTYGFLENIYSRVSQLDSRIETDQVRKRVALVLLHSEYLESYQDWKATRQHHHHHQHQPSPSSSSSNINSSSSSSSIKGGVGRGDMTLMIDNILEQTTPGWDSLSAKRKLQLRALFHERKRYGKRWAVFREEVGCAILLVCSAQLGNMVSNTKVTMAALKSIAQAIRESAPIMEVLSVLEPLAEALLNNDGYKAFGGFHEWEGQEDTVVGQMLGRFEEIQATRGSSQFDSSATNVYQSIERDSEGSSSSSCSSESSEDDEDNDDDEYMQ